MSFSVDLIGHVSTGMIIVTVYETVLTAQMKLDVVSIQQNFNM